MDAHVFGPFEVGFTEQQKSIIENWGCTDASVAYDSAGGLDLGVATSKVAKVCNIQLPRVEGTTWYGILGFCGGHTKDYHFHRDLACLYKEEGGHSTAVADSVGTQKIYGKWEDFANKKLPLLDACGGHFGPTPDSAGANVYHYHLQDRAPWTLGCFGPNADGGLVTVAQCRALYMDTDRGCARATETMTVESTYPPAAATGGTITYTRWCPCWDKEMKNVLPIVELDAIGSSEISYTTTIEAGDFGGYLNYGGRTAQVNQNAPGTVTKPPSDTSGSGTSGTGTGGDVATSGNPSLTSGAPSTTLLVASVGLCAWMLK